MVDEDVRGNGVKLDPLLHKFSELKSTFFATYHNQVDENRKFMERQFAQDFIPEAWAGSIDPVIPPTARRAITDPGDHILTTPRIFVPKKPTEGDETEQQLIAENKRAFLNAWWHLVNQGPDPLGSGMYDFLNEGRIAIRKTLKWDMLPDKPGKDASKKEKDKFRNLIKTLGRIEFMWEVEVLDSKTVYEDPSNHRDPQYVYVEYPILVEEAARLYPNTTGAWRQKRDYDTVTFIEYWSKPTFKPDGTWDPGEWIQWVDDERVHDVDNPYPYVPIVIEDSGGGSVRRGATVQQKYVGLTQHAHSIFLAQAKQWTSMEVVAEMTAFNPVFTRNMDPSKMLTVGPGLVIPLDGDEGQEGSEAVEIATWPPIPITVIQMIGLTEKAANEYTKMDVLTGIPQAGVETATEVTLSSQSATAKLKPAIRGLERLVARMCEQVLMDIELVLEAPITVFGAGTDVPGEIRLMPSEINGYYHVKVQLGTSNDDMIDQLRARFWAEMYRVVPFLSAFTAMERGRISDTPMNEMVRRAAEDVFLSEQMTLVRQATGAQSFGELVAMIDAIKETELGAPGANSADALVSNEQLAGGSGSVTDNALRDRDVTQAGAAFGGFGGA